MCFWGENLDKLYITTARMGLSDEQLGQFPDSGSVFGCDVGIRGLPFNPYRIK